MKKNELDWKISSLGMLFMLPAMLMICFVVIIPLLWNIALSFSSWSVNQPMSFLGLENYVVIFKDPQYLSTLWKSVFVAAVSTVVAMVLGIALALFIHRLSRREGSVFRFIFFLPSIMPMSVIGLLFVFVLSPTTGLLNQVLELLHLDFLTRAWLSDPKTVLWAIGIVQGWRFSGMIMMFVYTSILTIPNSLFESAKLDGATWFQEIKGIILPLVKPTINMACSLMLIWGFKSYGLVYAMTQGGPGNASETTPINMIKTAFTYNKFGLSSALGVIFTIVVMFVVIIGRKGLKSETYEF